MNWVRNAHPVTAAQKLEKDTCGLEGQEGYSPYPFPLGTWPQVLIMTKTGKITTHAMYKIT